MAFHNVRDSKGRFSKANGGGSDSAPSPIKTPSKRNRKATGILSAFLLDNSGSMQVKERVTIDGYNEILRNARTDSTKLKLANYELLAFFGDNYIPVGNVTELFNGKSGVTKDGKTGYCSDGGMTALHYATIRLIRDTEKTLEKLPFGTKVICTVFTDGGENHSRYHGVEYDVDAVAKLVRAKMAQGWVMNFIGAGNPAEVEATAGAMGFVATNTAAYDNTAKGTSKVMATMSASRGFYAKSAAAGTESNVGFFSKD